MLRTPRGRRHACSWPKAVLAAVAGVLSALLAAPAFASTVSVQPVPAKKSEPQPPGEVAAAAPDPCAVSGQTPVPKLVATVFRCRLTPRLGADQATKVAAEAVVVAQCESEFDPAAVVFGGAYVRRPHPGTGLYYTATGLFQFIRTTADRFIDGGYAAAANPVANTEGAVRVYLDSLDKGGRGWESWECAAVNGAFRPASVLPGWPGGPSQLPSWAYAY